MTEMEKHFNSQYDGVALLQEPIILKNDEDTYIPIYGILYNKGERHREDMWTWSLNRYICYLQSCQQAQNDGYQIAPEVWFLEDGNKVELNSEHKNFIYKTMKDKMADYRIVEQEKPFVFKELENDGIFVLSRIFWERYNNIGNDI